MSLNKSLSLGLAVSLLSQVAVGSAASADSPVTARSPEITPLSSVIALAGQKLSTADLEKQLQSQVEQYDAVAPVEGRAERVSQALVTMQVYTPEQAQVFEARVLAATQGLSSTEFASVEQAQQTLQAQLMGIALQSQGAQFSACDVAYTMYGVGMTAFFGGLISSVVINWNNLINGDGTFAKDGWLADAGIGGVVLGFVGAIVSADAECGQ